MDDFLEIDPRLAGISFYGVTVADHNLQRVRKEFFGTQQLLKEKRELFWHHAGS